MLFRNLDRINREVGLYAFATFWETSRPISSLTTIQPKDLSVKRLIPAQICIWIPAVLVTATLLFSSKAVDAAEPWYTMLNPFGNMPTIKLNSTKWITQPVNDLILEPTNDYVLQPANDFVLKPVDKYVLKPLWTPVDKLVVEPIDRITPDWLKPPTISEIHTGMTRTYHQTSGFVVQGVNWVNPWYSKPKAPRRYAVPQIGSKLRRTRGY